MFLETALVSLHHFNARISIEFETVLHKLILSDESKVQDDSYQITLSSVISFKIVVVNNV